MDEKLKSREKQLELAKVENEIATARTEIAQKKALEAEMKARYGTDWKKIIGYVGKSFGTNEERAHSLYSVDTSLRSLSIPRRLG